MNRKIALDFPGGLRRPRGARKTTISALVASEPRQSLAAEADLDFALAVLFAGVFPYIVAAKIGPLGSKYPRVCF